MSDDINRSNLYLEARGDPLFHEYHSSLQVYPMDSVEDNWTRSPSLHRKGRAEIEGGSRRGCLCNVACEKTSDGKTQTVFAL